MLLPSVAILAHAHRLGPEVLARIPKTGKRHLLKGDLLAFLETATQEYLSIKVRVNKTADQIAADCIKPLKEIAQQVHYSRKRGTSIAQVLLNSDEGFLFKDTNAAIPVKAFRIVEDLFDMNREYELNGESAILAITSGREEIRQAKRQASREAVNLFAVKDAPRSIQLELIYDAKVMQRGILKEYLQKVEQLLSTKE